MTTRTARLPRISCDVRFRARSKSSPSATRATCRSSCAPIRTPTSGSGSTSACRARADSRAHPLRQRRRARRTSMAGAATRPSLPTIATTGFGCRRRSTAASSRSRTTPARDSIYYAYFEPYSWERHLALAGTRRRVAARAGARPRRDGRGPRPQSRRRSARTAAARKSIWVIARQHPGETMAEWFVEGMLERLARPRRSRWRAACSSARCSTSCPT